MKYVADQQGESKFVDYLDVLETLFRGKTDLLFAGKETIADA
jgi:hypothetical protein